MGRLLRMVHEAFHIVTSDAKFKKICRILAFQGGLETLSAVLPLERRPEKWKGDRPTELLDIIKDLASFDDLDMWGVIELPNDRIAYEYQYIWLEMLVPEVGSATYPLMANVVEKWYEWFHCQTLPGVQDEAPVTCLLFDLLRYGEYDQESHWLRSNHKFIMTSFWDQERWDLEEGLMPSLHELKQEATREVLDGFGEAGTIIRMG
ncbi:hypothetical protein M426DRAFT_112682 [Hypoxylon sp. CI-4A]|nr:hypothetical protein M426DRAFT_112682 [Hypoxylon sp. CI-4A]